MKELNGSTLLGYFSSHLFFLLITLIRIARKLEKYSSTGNELYYSARKYSEYHLSKDLRLAAAVTRAPRSNCDWCTQRPSSVFKPAGVAEH